MGRVPHPFPKATTRGKNSSSRVQIGASYPPPLPPSSKVTSNIYPLSIPGPHRWVKDIMKLKRREGTPLYFPSCNYVGDLRLLLHTKRQHESDDVEAGFGLLTRHLLPYIPKLEMASKHVPTVFQRCHAALSDMLCARGAAKTRRSLSCTSSRSVSSLLVAERLPRVSLQK